MALLLDRQYCYCAGYNADVLIDPRVDQSRISATFVKILDHSGASLPPDSFPIVVPTRRGVYVTAIGLSSPAHGLSATPTFVEDCHSSWGNARVAWFSWAFQPAMVPEMPTVLWKPAQSALAALFAQLLNETGRAFVSCGPITTSFLSGPSPWFAPSAPQQSAILLPRNNWTSGATGAYLPTELLPHVLKYIGTNADGSSRLYTGGLENLKEEYARDMERCTLVCVDWANRSRQRLFRKRIFKLESLTDLATLEAFTRQGSPRLIPMVSRISGFHVRQNWTKGSWCHKLANSFLHTRTVRPNIRYLALLGPFPHGLPPAALRSPHWSLPRTLPSNFTQFTAVYLRDIHFPSLFDIAKMTRHFKLARTLRFERVKWDKNDADALIPVRPVSNASLTLVDAAECTDDLVVCAEASRLLGSDIPFRELSEEDRMFCSQLARTASSPEPRSQTFMDPSFGVKASPHFSGFTLIVDVQRDTDLDFGRYLEYRLATHVLCDDVPQPNTNSFPKQIVGYIFEFLDSPGGADELYDITTLFNFQGVYSAISELEETALRVVAFAFPHFAALEFVVNRHAELREPLELNGQLTYLFACQRSSGQPFSKVRVCGREDWIVIDPATLQATGQSWEQTAIFTSLLNKH